VIGVVALAMFAALLALGAVLPFLANALGAHLPATANLDGGAFAVLVAGLLVVAILVAAFAALATLLVRSGGLALVAALVYVIVEAAVLTVLVQIPPLRAGEGLDWIPNVFPVRGAVTFVGSAMNAAGRVPSFPGEVLDRSIAAAWVPLVALSIWAVVALILAFRRFGQMDIVE
jgi:hypothetical protein